MVGVKTRERHGAQNTADEAIGERLEHCGAGANPEGKREHPGNGRQGGHGYRAQAAAASLDHGFFQRSNRGLRTMSASRSKRMPFLATMPMTMIMPCGKRREGSLVSAERRKPPKLESNAEAKMAVAQRKCEIQRAETANRSNSARNKTPT